MRDVLARFDERVREVEAYFRFLIAAEAGSAGLRPGVAPRVRDHLLDADLRMMLRASAFLILYNLVESTMRGSISAICTSVKSDCLSCGDISGEVRRQWINHRYRTLEPDSAARGSYVEIAHKLVDEAISGDPVDLDDYRLRGGNIGGRQVRDLAEAWGFKAPGGTRLREAGTLDTIKEMRNGLAHGYLSFAECGRQYTAPQLEQIKRHVVTYLRAVLRNIERYLTSKRYAVP